jgi:DNA-binding protein Fis
MGAGKQYTAELDISGALGSNRMIFSSTQMPGSPNVIAMIARLEKQRRELKELIEQLRSLDNIGPLSAEGLSFHDHEKRLLEAALDKTGRNQSQAAQILKITRSQMRYKMRKHGLM